MYAELYELPQGLLELPARDLHAFLGGPTLIHLQGRREPPLFVSVLMHGNEDEGWEALRQLLKKYRAGGGEQELPRSLSLFIGNTSAAAVNMRRLAGQPDYNRVWPGSDLAPTAEHAMMESIVDSMARKGVFASVDVHNNTGLNPHYACVNAVRTESLHLAAMFSRTVVYFTRPRGVQSMAMTELCPAVTLECGKVGQVHGIAHASEYLDACLHLAQHPVHSISPHDIDLFHTVAIVKIPPEVSFGFGCQNHDLCLLDDLEVLNFREIPAGTSFGRVDKDRGIPLDVKNESNHDVAARYFTVENGELLTRTPVMPSMLTRNEAVIRQDCLCYLMERYDLHLEDAG
ncbi:MAG TPA: peptidase M14 [Thiolapillus brandeum]|uniref:Peptidase M14 n=1 Tax=Thiolapillus brandeum TaxID=1076588 RepID=A0A831NVF2_9GAMM|nr:peptidase M14 [Thiolapillus brandeum]